MGIDSSVAYSLVACSPVACSLVASCAGCLFNAGLFTCCLFTSCLYIGCLFIEFACALFACIGCLFGACLFTRCLFRLIHLLPFQMFKYFRCCIDRCPPQPAVASRCFLALCGVSWWGHWCFLAWFLERFDDEAPGYATAVTTIAAGDGVAMLLNLGFTLLAGVAATWTAWKLQSWKKT